RAVLLAYLDPGEDVVGAVAENMVAWFTGDWPDRVPGSRPRDVGGATRAGLQRYTATGDPRSSGAGLGQAGNGSLMRCVPTAPAAATGQTFLAGDGSGYVLDSFTLAVAAVLDQRALVEVLVDIVRVGRDTDTNAAIAGGLLGARDGASGIPEAWLTRLQFEAEFTAAADVLAARGAEP